MVTVRDTILARTQRFWLHYFQGVSKGMIPQSEIGIFVNLIATTLQASSPYIGSLRDSMATHFEYHLGRMPRLQRLCTYEDHESPSSLIRTKKETRYI